MSTKINPSKNKDSAEVIKNYHKQAFEYISRALRIDEADTGLCFGFIVLALWCGDVTYHEITLPLCIYRRKTRCCAVVQKGD